MSTLFAVVEWFASSRLGRAVAAGTAIALAIALALLKAFGAGKEAERARQDRASLENLRKRQEIDEGIQDLPPDDVRRRLGEWVRDDAKQ